MTIERLRNGFYGEDPHGFKITYGRFATHPYLPEWRYKVFYPFVLIYSAFMLRFVWSKRLA